VLVWAITKLGCPTAFFTAGQASSGTRKRTDKNGSSAAVMPRYVILRHELPPESGRALHWDLMLEWQGALRTWALANEPLSMPEMAAEQLPDHRLAYLDYEGPVSGDRGSVMRWDAGEYSLGESDAARFVVTLCGARLNGVMTLEQETGAGHSWRVAFVAAPTTG
jgi:hypothetical protein